MSLMHVAETTEMVFNRIEDPQKMPVKELRASVLNGIGKELDLDAFDLGCIDIDAEIHCRFVDFELTCDIDIRIDINF